MTTDEAVTEAAPVADPDPPRRFGVLDPVGLATAAAAAAIFVLHRFDGILTRDLALYAYAGQQVADGVPPYVGVMNRSGPLAHLVPGAGAALGRLAGADDLRAERVLMCVLSVALIWVTYLLGRDLFASRLAGVAAAASVLMIPGIIVYATGGPREKTTMMLLLTLLLLACLHRRWWWTGVLLALATLTWQPVLFLGAAAALVCALGVHGRRLGALLRIGAGGALTTLGFVAYFVAAGATRAALDGFVVIHLRYTHQPGIATDPRKAWDYTVEALGASTYVVLVGIAALLLAGPIAVVRRGRGAADWALAGYALALVAGLVWSYRTFNGWADALVLVPLAAVGIGAIAALVARIPGRIGALAVSAAVVLALVSASDYSVHGGENGLAKQQAEVDRVFAIVPDATIMAFEAPQPLVLSGRTNLSRYQMFRLGLEDYVDATYPGGLDGFAAWVQREHPTLIAVGIYGHHRWMQPVLDRDYERFGTTWGWYWYVAQDTDRATVERLREAVTG